MSVMRLGSFVCFANAFHATKRAELPRRLQMRSTFRAGLIHRATPPPVRAIRIRARDGSWACFASLAGSIDSPTGDLERLQALPSLALVRMQHESTPAQRPLPVTGITPASTPQCASLD
ncbi:hypothetical protein SBA5_450008 [Candidatus Sulfotelmatomonas gaucii]|uniref:Uncharacterized protein n=1 Tax=Candidatus Sulfuritelmatomonas gaucii TaxID=2043161 RepID=A0A2N9LMH2_9BACT|nr:hypothetical protein SBA5_450008 [Candidatus Sulfotelmatomonas gaucii]